MKHDVAPDIGALHAYTDRSALRANLAAARGFLSRDTKVLLRNWREFVSRVMVQPTLFVFAFTYVLPRIGGGVGTGVGGITFSTVALGGLMSYAGTYAALFGIGLSLSVDLGLTREIDDRIGAPVPVGMVAVEKVVFGALQGVLASLLVVPSFLLIPYDKVQVDVNVPLLVGVVIATSLVAGSMGLLIGTLVPHDRLGSMFSFLPLILLFLGCTYYPWQALSSIRWLQIAVLVNPSVYIAESLRAAMTPAVPHMNPAISLPVLLGFGAVILTLGIRQFVHRVTE